MAQYNSIISKFNNKYILVIGDLILDQYIRGSVSRISPEAPVPIVLQQGETTFTPGGSANVANNLHCLGAKVVLLGRIGPDNEGKILLEQLRKAKISNEGIFVDKTIPTSVKTRIIAEHQQVVRVDREKTEDAAKGPVGDRIAKFIKDNIAKFDAVILSDYGKGVITSKLVEGTCRLALDNKKIITVDPKVEHFGYYQGVTAITPNKKEAENAIQNLKVTHNAGRRLGINSYRLEKDEDINAAGQALMKYLDLESLLITLGERGMQLFEKGKKPVHIDTKAKEVFDVSGAGDTVIAVYTLSLTAGATKHQAAELANYAAGVVVGKTGAVPITKQELLAALNS